MTDSIRVAAEQARVALQHICTHSPRTPRVIDADWDNARAALASLEAALAALPGEPVAWMTEDGRTISDKQKAALIADGGASATSMRSFSIPLVHSAATPTQQVPPIAGRDGASAAPSDEGSAWQPIETAPHEGEVLCWWPHLGRARVSYRGRNLPGWRAYVGKTVRSSGMVAQPTHWMPLPAPPRQVAHSSQAQGELSVKEQTNG